MQKQLLSLVDLQKIDLEIIDLNNKLSAEEEELERLKAELEPKLKEFEAKKEKLNERELETKKNDTELKEKEEHLKTLQQQLYNVKNAKELNAIDTEISTVKKQISELEDLNIKALEELDTLKKEIEEEEKIISEQEKNVKELEEKIAEEKKGFEAEADKLRAKREAIAETIDDELLRDYEFIAKNKDGVGIVAVKNGVCSGCYMTIPPQTVNDIRKGFKIHHCQFCSRILYYPEWEN